MGIHWGWGALAVLGLVVGVPTSVVAAFDAWVPAGQLRDRPGHEPCEVGALLDLGLVRRAAACDTWTEPRGRVETYREASQLLEEARHSVVMHPDRAVDVLDVALDLWRLGDRMAHTGDVMGASIGAQLGLDASEVVRSVLQQADLSARDGARIASELEALAEASLDVDALVSRELDAEVDVAWRLLGRGKLLGLAKVVSESSVWVPTAGRIEAVGRSVEARRALKPTLEHDLAVALLEVVDQLEGNRNRAIGLAVTVRTAERSCPESVDRLFRERPTGGILLQPWDCQVVVWDHPGRSPMRTRLRRYQEMLPAGRPTGRGVRTDFTWSRAEEERQR